MNSSRRRVGSVRRPRRETAATARAYGAAAAIVSLAVPAFVFAASIPEQGPVKFIEDQDEHVFLVVSGAREGGVARVEGTAPGAEIAKGEIGDAAFGRDGMLYYISGKSVMAQKAGSTDKPVDLAAEFGGAPAATARLKCLDDGSIWVEGAAKYRCVDGTYKPVPRPSAEAAVSPVPWAADPFGNAWALIPAGAEKGRMSVAVLPAQSSVEWKAATEGDTSAGPWHSLIVDDFGFVWVAGGKTLRRLDPRSPAGGWLEFTAADGLPDSEITALAVAPSGSVLVGFASGQLAECDQEEKNPKKVTILEFPAAKGRIRAALTDGAGSMWVVAGNAVARKDTPADAWQKNWKLMCRLPFGNHDFDGAVLGRKLFLVGGLTLGWGFPAVRHMCDEIWMLDWDKKIWQVPAKLPEQRCYSGVAVLNGKLWIVDGQVMDGKGQKSVNTVLIYDPEKRTVEQGPATSAIRFGPVAVTIGDRIYVSGGEREKGGGPALTESIGAGEKEWRKEPDSPINVGPVSGCESKDKLYLLVPRTGVIAFDPATRQWDAALPAPPQTPRSSQVIVYKGKLWLLGGRDTKKQTEVFRYSFATKTWDAGPDLPRPMAWGVAAEFDGKLTVSAGAIGRCFANQTYMLRQAE